MTESSNNNYASARKSTESILREALAHEGHKQVAERIGFNASNISRLLSGDQTTHFKRFCDMVDACGLKLVPNDEIHVERENFRLMAKICSSHFEHLAQ